MKNKRQLYLNCILLPKYLTLLMIGLVYESLEILILIYYRNKKKIYFIHLCKLF